MSATNAESPAEEDWTSHREQLTQWYRRDNKPLHQVMALMEEKYGFVAKKNQYEKYLHSKWKLCKRTKSHVWKAVAPIVHELERRGQHFELWIGGEKKSPHTIRKETRRYPRTAKIPLSNITFNCLPRGVIIREVSLKTQPQRTIDLPFLHLEQYLDANMLIIQARNALRSSLRISTAENELVQFLTSDGPALRALQVATLNQKDLGISSSITSAFFDSQVSLSLTNRNILFSLANNFAGLHALSNGPLCAVLLGQMSSILGKLICTTTPYRSLHAIGQALYHLAIVSGDSSIAQFLLNQSIPSVKPNCFLVTKYGYNTPIEVAARDQHKDLVKILLDFGADPNLTSRRDGYNPYSGALNSLVSMWRPQKRLCIDQELFELLLNNGADLNCQSFSHLIRHDQSGHLVALTLLKTSTLKHKVWSSKHIFHEIFEFQKHEILLLTWKIMREHDVDVNRDKLARSKSLRPTMSWELRIMDRQPSTLVDITACKGDLIMVRELLTNRARTTDETMHWAIASGNEQLVRWMLNRDLTVDHTAKYWDLALAAAIRKKNLELINSIEEKCSKFGEPLDAAVTAASEVGNWDFFRRFYKSRSVKVDDASFDESMDGEADTTFLEDALIYSIEDGQDLIALELLDAGVSASARRTGRRRYREYQKCFGDNSSAYGIQSRSETLDLPLVAALKKRNSWMVDKLLDAGAIAGHMHDSYLFHAVLWGHPSIIANILDAGLSSKQCHDLRALNAAISCKDIETLDMLLEAGLSIDSRHGSDLSENDYEERERVQTVLVAAVQTSDLTVVDHVLQAGADPHDPDALYQAFKDSSVMFDLILRQHFLRYPKGRKGWGGRILVENIKKRDLALFKQIVDSGADVNEFVVPHKRSLLVEAEPDGLQISTGPDEETFSWSDATSAFGHAIIRSSRAGIEFADHLLQAVLKTGCKAESTVSEFSPGDFIEGRTAFLEAIDTRYIPIIELLIQHRADVNFPAKHNILRTPLQQAAETGDLDVIRLLLKHGADVNGPAAYRRGGTALQLAAIEGHIRITLLLLEQGADVHAAPSKLHGRTALEGASEHGRLDTVALLLQYYGAYEAKHKEEFARAIAYAERNNFDYIADLLREHQGVSSVPFDEFLDFGSLE